MQATENELNPYAASNFSMRILLVKESTIDAISLECILEDLGHRVVAVAVTLDQVDKILFEMAGAIDLVIFDALLSGMPSVALSEKIADYNLPAIVQSIMTEEDIRALSFQDEYLPQYCTDEDIHRMFCDMGLSITNRIA